MKLILGKGLTILVREEDFKELTIGNTQINYTRPDGSNVVVRFPEAMISSRLEEAQKEILMQSTEKQAEADFRKKERKEALEKQRAAYHEKLKEKISEEVTKLRTELTKKIETADFNAGKAMNAILSKLKADTAKEYEARQAEFKEMCNGIYPKLAEETKTLNKKLTETKSCLETRTKLLESSFDDLAKENSMVEEEISRLGEATQAKMRSIQEGIDELVDDLVDAGSLRLSNHSPHCQNKSWRKPRYRNN